MGKYSDHASYVNNKEIEVPSATTVLKCLSTGDGLIKWSNFLGLIKRTKYQEFMDEAASFGTLVHDAFEHFYKDGEYYPKLNDKFPDELPKLNATINNFMEKFNSVNTVLPLWTEQSFSGELYGGTVDMYCELNGKKTILDYKTSSGFKLQQFLQLGAYTQLLEENKYPVEQVCILIVNPKKCELKIMSRNDIQEYIDTFNIIAELFHKVYNLQERDGWKRG